MKRIFTFLLAGIFTLGLVNAQTNLVVNGGFEEWTSDTEPTGDWKKAENLEKEATEKHSGNFSAKQTGGTKDIQQLISGIEAGSEYTLTVWYKVAGETDDTDARIWSKWMTGDAYDHNTDKDKLQGPANLYFPNNGGAWTKYETTVTAPTGVDGFSFEVRTYGSAITYWDDFSFVKKEASSAKVATPTFTPEPGVALGLTYVKIECETEGANILFTIDGTDPEAPSLTNTEGVGYPYVAGVVDSILLNPFVTKHTVKAIAFKLGMENSNIAVGDYQYPVLVDNIAAIRSKTPNDGEIYALQTSFILTMQQSFRNQKYIQDESGAILIDDASGVNLNNFEIGDEITGIGGKLSEYGGMLQFTLVNTLYATKVHDKDIMPKEITITDLNTNFEMYESQLVTIKGVSFVAADTISFTNGTVYEITDGTNTGKFRTTFYDVDYIGDVVPSGKYNITGIMNSRNDGEYISARMKSDLVLDRTAVNGIDAQVAKVFSMPHTLVVEPTQTSDIVVYNLSGKVITQVQSISGRVEIPLAKGIVLVKISNGLQSQTAKIMIK